MRVSLRFIGREPGDLRWFITADSRHAGGITVHSINGDVFSYGIAIAPALRRRGIAALALLRLLDEMKSRGYTRAVVQVSPDNAASLALHRSLGFEETGRSDARIALEKALG